MTFDASDFSLDHTAITDKIEDVDNSDDALRFAEGDRTDMEAFVDGLLSDINALSRDADDFNINQTAILEFLDPEADTGVIKKLETKFTDIIQQYQNNPDDFASGGQYWGKQESRNIQFLIALQSIYDAVSDAPDADTLASVTAGRNYSGAENTDGTTTRAYKLDGMIGAQTRLDIGTAQGAVARLAQVDNTMGYDDDPQLDAMTDVNMDVMADVFSDPTTLLGNSGFMSGMIEALQNPALQKLALQTATTLVADHGDTILSAFKNTFPDISIDISTITNNPQAIQTLITISTGDLTDPSTLLSQIPTLLQSLVPQGTAIADVFSIANIQKFAAALFADDGVRRVLLDTAYTIFTDPNLSDVATQILPILQPIVMNNIDGIDQMFVTAVQNNPQIITKLDQLISLASTNPAMMEELLTNQDIMDILISNSGFVSTLVGIVSSNPALQQVIFEHIVSNSAALTSITQGLGITTLSDFSNMGIPGFDITPMIQSFIPSMIAAPGFSDVLSQLLTSSQSRSPDLIGDVWGALTDENKTDLLNYITSDDFTANRQQIMGVLVQDLDFIEDVMDVVPAPSHQQTDLDVSNRQMDMAVLTQATQSLGHTTIEMLKDINSDALLTLTSDLLLDPDIQNAALSILDKIPEDSQVFDYAQTFLTSQIQFGGGLANIGIASIKGLGFGRTVSILLGTSEPSAKEITDFFGDQAALRNLRQAVAAYEGQNQSSFLGDMVAYIEHQSQQPLAHMILTPSLIGSRISLDPAIGQKILQKSIPVLATQIRSYSGDLSSTIDNMLANMGTDQIKGIIEFVLSSDNTDDVMQALMANEAIRTTLLNHAQYSVKLLPILINNNTLKNQVLPQIPTIISNLANQGIAVGQMQMQTTDFTDLSGPVSSGILTGLNIERSNIRSSLSVDEQNAIINLMLSGDLQDARTDILAAALQDTDILNAIAS